MRKCLYNSYIYSGINVMMTLFTNYNDILTLKMKSIA